MVKGKGINRGEVWDWGRGSSLDSGKGRNVQRTSSNTRKPLIVAPLVDEGESAVGSLREGGGGESGVQDTSNGFRLFYLDPLDADCLAVGNAGKQPG